ncbi:thermonuclease family protein [Thiolapillus brandeum]|uniref:Nuclease family protein n=1 Tax=Thiolapillus brandeum TaxID=1076588 RepID=A0A7U6JI53_9GAMM|nr:thermonuclease family protein [Thiolapillus brandeum]BAO43885.1 nuclease family protein [Thiolapillus brandeum]
MKVRGMFKAINHKRLSLFWMVAIVGIALPWILNIPAISAQSTETEICEVRSIYDGDTMTVKCDGERKKIRLYCIDAPEMKQRPWGKESKDYLRAITPKQVKVVKHGKDRYGRTIGEVWTHDGDDIQENLNLAMVYAGRAVVYPKYCRDQQYYQAQEGVKKLGSGIWEKDGDWQRPWEYRKAKRNR